MTLAKTPARILAVLAMSVCLVSWVGAQDKPADKAAAQAKPAKKAAGKGKGKAAVAKAAATAPRPNAGAAPDVGKLEPIVAKRDPFEPLVNDKQTSHGPLPPGKAGLIIASVHVDGTVKMTNGMIAVVSNPEQRVYFIREGDRLYDGEVQKIGLDGVTFKENTKDAFGKPVERIVTKRIYPSAGEQQ